MPPNPLDAAVFGDTVRFTLSTAKKAASMADLRTQTPRAAEFPEDGETSNSDDKDDDDDDDLPFLR